MVSPAVEALYFVLNDERIEAVQFIKGMSTKGTKCPGNREEASARGTVWGSHPLKTR